MKLLDVKNIIDIPDIEYYLGSIFTLDCFDIGDNIQCYTLPLEGNTCINLEIISDENIITNNTELAELLTQEPIHYLAWSICLEGGDIPEIITLYNYRPLLDDNAKTFYKPNN